MSDFFKILAKNQKEMLKLIAPVIEMNLILKTKKSRRYYRHPPQFAQPKVKLKANRSTVVTRRTARFCR